MFRKVLFGVLTLLLALCMVGCGDDKPAADGDKKADTPAAQKVEGSADKAVLAYAQLYAYGIIEDENQAAAGMIESEIKDVQDKVLAPLVQAFQGYPLSDENVAEITGEYVGKLHKAMDMKTKIKKDDPEHPVVELTATTIDQAGAAKVAESDENLIALGTELGQLQAQGLTEEQIKGDAEFQAMAMEAINKFIDGFPLNDKSSIEITCEAVKGSDGKMYWAPKDPTEIAKFVSGQK